MEALGAFAVIAIPVGIFLGILYSLSPLIIMWQLGGIKQRLDKGNKANGASHIQRTAGETASVEISTELYRELQKQNELTRQLLRAYGHEPEA